MILIGSESSSERNGTGKQRLDWEKEYSSGSHNSNFLRVCSWQETAEHRHSQLRHHVMYLFTCMQSKQSTLYAYTDSTDWELGWIKELGWDPAIFPLDTV